MNNKQSQASYLQTESICLNLFSFMRLWVLSFVVTFFKDLLIYLKECKTGKKHTKMFSICLLVYSPECHSSQGCAMLKPGARNFIHVSQKCSTELDWKCSDKNKSQCPYQMLVSEASFTNHATMAALILFLFTNLCEQDAHTRCTSNVFHQVHMWPWVNLLDFQEHFLAHFPKLKNMLRKGQKLLGMLSR